MKDNLQFITRDEVIELTPLNQFVVEAELNLCIDNAVDLYLGQALQEIKSDLLTAIKAKNASSSGTITEANQAIWTRLKQPLAWFVYYQWLITYGRMRVTKSGVGLKETTDFDASSAEEFKDYAKGIYDIAKTFLGNFNDWLDENEIDKGSDELDDDPLLDWSTVSPDIT